jgi:hypothetical protein
MPVTFVAAAGWSVAAALPAGRSPERTNPTVEGQAAEKVDGRAEVAAGWWRGQPSGLDNQELCPLHTNPTITNT